MWANIKKSIEKNAIIWWAASCFKLVMSGALYVVIKMEQQQQEYASEHLTMWFVAWALITAMGIWSCVAICFIDASNKDSLDKNEAFNSAKGDKDYDVDGHSKLDTVTICQNDGPVTAEQFV